MEGGLSSRATIFLNFFLRLPFQLFGNTGAFMELSIEDSLYVDHVQRLINCELLIENKNINHLKMAWMSFSMFAAKM